MIQNILEMDTLQDFSTTETLVAAFIADAGTVRLEEVTEATNVSDASAYSTLSALADRDLVRVETDETASTGGRKPNLYVATGELASVSRDGGDPMEAELAAAVIAALAQAHYQRRVSTLRSKQIRRQLPFDITSSRVANALKKLEAEDVVETVGADSRSARWRLVGADTVAPYRAPATAGGDQR